jgi:hypothetical protein
VVLHVPGGDPNSALITPGRARFSQRCFLMKGRCMVLWSISTTGVVRYTCMAQKHGAIHHENRQ